MRYLSLVFKVFQGLHFCLGLPKTKPKAYERAQAHGALGEGIGEHTSQKERVNA